jgi:hypothetical protein
VVTDGRHLPRAPAGSVLPLAKGSQIHTLQVTYHGHPPYFFALRLNSGVSGAGFMAFGGTFNIVHVNGTVG